MKILFISMPSIHAIRWMENLKESSYELYWFDILDKGQIKNLHFLTQITNWKTRKISPIKGEYFLCKKLPILYYKIEGLFEVTKQEKLEDIINQIQPDIVHSFEMQSCSYPILKTMNKYPNLKWVYSCWGNDLFYYQNIKSHNSKIRKALARVNFLHTDCQRDHTIAKELGFKGKYLGLIPGGAGYKLEKLEKFKLPIEERIIILVKGYQHKFGRALSVVKALALIREELKGKEVIIFSAHQIVSEYVTQNKLPFKIIKKEDELAHNEILKIMGKSLIYIGNSISDGMPNTLLEAIVMGAFPIQSNPGAVTAEIIENEVNGMLIEEPNNIESIKKIIQTILKNKIMIQKAFEINANISKEKLNYQVNQNKVLDLYSKIFN